jgi:hypothetical protein
LKAFIEEGAEFLVVGAYALAVYGLPRATGDIDLWINNSSDNTSKVWSALEKFGAPLGQIKRNDLEEQDVVYQIGVVPNRIDIMTSIDDVEFEDAWNRRFTLTVEGLDIPVLSREHLIKNKKAVGRPQDLVDIDYLEKLD